MADFEAGPLIDLLVELDVQGQRNQCVFRDAPRPSNAAETLNVLRARLPHEMDSRPVIQVWEAQFGAWVPLDDVNAASMGRAGKLKVVVSATSSANDLNRNNRFDPEWSGNYFTVSADRMRATFQRGSDVIVVSDYHLYPAVRCSGNVSHGGSVKFRMPQYGWFGVGTDQCPPDGFPGYLPSGFMVRITGGAHHNTHTVDCDTPNLTGKIVTMTYVPEGHQLLVASEGNQWTVPLGTFPQPAFFVFSIATGQVTLIE
eukprot:TRINITY_DN28678_c0_g1_i1.p1 TRINITY_DN28678_c0_g1~~TRINITY_DN28678_c0_g1_i1.p1  ORF type:complete len:257 (+),score=21.56 TRINITY_DN28678_c0_g1_i1:82-852(+)